MTRRLLHRLLGDRCPICRCRCRFLPVHIRIDHAESEPYFTRAMTAAAQAGRVASQALFGEKIAEANASLAATREEYRRAAARAAELERRMERLRRDDDGKPWYLRGSDE